MDMPTVILNIAKLVLLVLIGRGIYDSRAQIVRAFCAVWDHFVVSRTSPEPDETGSMAGSERVEPLEILDTSQFKPRAPAVLEPPADPLIISHKMSKKELTILLAVQRDGDGAYRFSANRIADFVGGTSAEVKGWVAEVRGRREPAASSLRRPANGW